MELELGQHILSSDGQDIGTIKHLILDPVGKQVKTFVVEKGWFLPDDVEIPLDAIQEQSEHGLTLRYSSEQSKALPRFAEGQYLPAVSEMPDSVTAYPVGSLLLPNGYVSPPVSNSGFPLFMPILDGEIATPTSSQEEERLRQLDENNAVISIGDEVMSGDMEKVGEVHNVFFDSGTGRPTRLIVRHGWLFHKDWEISAEMIASVDDGVIYLRQDKTQLQTRRQEELYTTEWGQDHQPHSRS